MTALLRLMWRPVTVWNVFLVASIALGVLLLAGAARGAAAEQPGFRAAMLAILLPIAAGTLLAWSCFELLLCPFSWALPGVRRRMAAALALGALVVAAGAWALAFGSAHSPVALGALALLGYAFGFSTSDPEHQREPWHGWTLFAVFLASLVLAPEIVALADEHAAILLPVALVAGGATLLRPFRARRSAARAMWPTSQIGMVYLEPDYRLGAAAMRQRWSSEPAPPPRAGGRLRSRLDWVRAALYESLGFSRGGAIAALVVQPVALAVLVVALAAAFWAVGDRTQPDVWAGARHALLSDFAQFGAIALYGWAAIHFVGSPFVFIARLSHPLSRRRRAELAWLTSGLQSGIQIAGVGAALALADAVTGRLAGAPGLLPSGAGGVPAYVGMIALLAVFAPAAQWARLRFVDSLEARPSALRMGMVAGAVAVSLVLLMVAADEGRLLDRWPTRELAAAWLASLVATQLLWRVALRRHFRTRDLV